MSDERAAVRETPGLGLRLGAVVPAAGLSSRMGRLKPALPLCGTTLLQRAVSVLRRGGAQHVAVVTGREPDTVAALAREAGAEPVHNPRFEEGMFTSVAAGVAALPPGLDAFFVLPADIPLVRPATVRLLAEAFSAVPCAVLHPRFRGQRGHPPLLRADLAPAILAHDGTGGLRAVLEAHEAEARDLDTADAGILLDLDRPEDYEDALARAETRRLPRPEEIEALWDLAGTPPDTRDHCRAVARAAGVLARALTAAAPQMLSDMDPALAEAAGLLHDVAKGRPGHEEQGALLVSRHGFCALGPAIAAHRDLGPPADGRPTERDAVFLADKFVRGTQVLPLEERYREKLERWGGDPEVRRAIEGRLGRARAVRDQAQGLAGTDLYDLLRREFA